MEDVLAREVKHPESNGHATECRHHDHVERRDVVGGIGIGKLHVGLDREPVDLRDDEHTLVDVEGMVERAGIEDGPFLDRADLELRHDPLAKLLAVDVEVVDIDDPALLHLSQLLQCERSLEVGRRAPERVCILGFKHRRGRGHCIAFDDEGGQHVVVAFAACVDSRLFAAPSVHEVVGARGRGGGDRQRHPVAWAEHGQGGDVVHPQFVGSERHVVRVDERAVSVPGKNRGIPRVLQIVVGDDEVRGAAGPKLAHVPDLRLAGTDADDRIHLAVDPLLPAFGVAIAVVRTAVRARHHFVLAIWGDVHLRDGHVHLLEFVLVLRPRLERIADHDHAGQATLNLRLGHLVHVWVVPVRPHGV